jgi:hypothetical protein
MKHAQRKPHAERIGIRRLSATGSIVLTVLFIAAWLATQVPGSMAFMYVRIFTYSAPASARALVDGLVWSSLLGFAVGFLTAVTYNVVGRLDEMPDLLSDEEQRSIRAAESGFLERTWRK